MPRFNYTFLNTQSLHTFFLQGVLVIFNISLVPLIAQLSYVTSIIRAVLFCVAIPIFLSHPGTINILLYLFIYLSLIGFGDRRHIET